jgi:hypothetical protein
MPNAVGRPKIPREQPAATGVAGARPLPVLVVNEELLYSYSLPDDFALRLHSAGSTTRGASALITLMTAPSRTLSADTKLQFGERNDGTCSAV